MIPRISHYMLCHQILSPDQKTQFEFGLEVLIHNLVITLICLCAGIFYEQILVTIIFLILFPLLRQHTESMHAESKLQCLIVSLCMYNLTLWIYSYTTQEQLQCISVLIILYIKKHRNLGLEKNITYVFKLLSTCFGFGLYFSYLHCIELAKLQFALILLIGGEQIIMNHKKSPHLQSYITKLIHCVMAISLAVGAYAIQTPCNFWAYKFEVPEELKKRQ